MYKKLSLAVATTLFASSMFANQAIELGQISVITSGGESDKKFKSNVIYSEDIALQEKNTVLDALNTISGITINNHGNRGENTVSIRGFSARHSPVFIDGIAINVPSEGYIDFSNYTTFDLSQIQVSKGLSSTLLGVNTFAGAINLVTRKPKKEFEATVSGGVFTGDGKKTYINLGTNQGKYYVQASGSYYNRDDFPMSDNFNSNINQDNDKRVNSQKRDRKINLKVGYTPNDTDEYAINYINQKTEKGMPYNVHSSKLGKNSYRKWDYSNKESVYFLSNTNFKYGYFKSRVFYDKYEDNMLFYTDRTYKKQSSDPTPYDANTKGISLELGQYDTERNSLKLAFHYKEDTQKSLEDKTYVKKVGYLSIGLEDTFKITDDFRVVVGASWDRDDVKQADNDNYDANGTKPHENEKEFKHKSSDAFNPMIKLEYDIDDTFGLYAGVAKKSRFGSLKERYSFRMGSGVPNPDLKPEKTINYEVGTSKTFDNQGVKAVFFYSDVKDYIQSRELDINSKKYTQNYNIGKVKHTGYELEYYYAIDEMLDFNASYTRLLAKDKSNKEQITDAPHHKVAMSLTYRPIHSLTTNLNMQYSSSRHSDSQDKSQDVGGGAIWNAKVAYEIFKGLTFDVGASNIFDKNYEYTYGYPEPGRIIYSNLTYRF